MKKKFPKFAEIEAVNKRNFVINYVCFMLDFFCISAAKFQHFDYQIGSFIDKILSQTIINKMRTRNSYLNNIYKQSFVVAF